MTEQSARCEFCGEPATAQVTLAEPVYRNGSQLRPAKTADVCAHHARWTLHKPWTARTALQRQSYREARRARQ